MSSYKPPERCETIDDIILAVQVRDSGQTWYEGQPVPRPWNQRDTLLVAEIERLRGIVDRLPKTADGVAVIPGMELWVINIHNGEVYRWANAGAVSSGAVIGCGGNIAQSSHYFYSTREAAEAAKEPTDD